MTSVENRGSGIFENPDMMLIAGTRLVPTNRLPRIAKEECSVKWASSAKYFGEESAFLKPIFEKMYFPYFLDTR